ncbi:MAG: hemin receptor [Rhodanobacteraceae bacterium]|nr:hemin receptor [Rhodanobacteraceae bacterium]
MQSPTSRIVQSSFAELAPLAPQMGRIFYAELFALDPTLRTLFVGNIERQGDKLVQMIGAAVNLLDQPRRLMPVLRQLGQRHVGYGVRRSHYDVVGLALVRTLELTLGNRFTDEVRAAWIKFYRLVATTMMAAADELADAA